MRVLSFLIVISGSPAWGRIIEATAGGTALRFPSSVRQAGIGNSSIVGDDAGAAWRNAALLADQEPAWSFAGSGGSLLGGETRTYAVSGGYRLGDDWRVGGVLVSSGGSFSEIDANLNPVNRTVNQSTTAAGLTAAVRERSWFALGVTVKLLRDEVLTDHVTAPLADLGMRFTIGPVNAGLALSNLGGKLRKHPVYRLQEYAPTDFSASVSWNPIPSLCIGAESTLEAEAFYSDQSLGVEWRMNSTYAMRIGTILPESEAAWMTETAGFSVSWRTLKLDYAFQMHPSASSHVIGLTVAFDRRN